MRHADHNIAHPKRATTLDDLLQRGDQAFPAIQAKAFGAGVFDVQKFLKPFGFNHLIQDCFAPLTGECDLFIAPLDTFFKP